MNRHHETPQRTLTIGDILRAVDSEEHETYFFQVIGAEHQTAWIRPIAARPRNSTAEQGWVVPVPLEFTGEARRRRIVNGESVEVAPGEYARPWRPIDLGDGRRQWALSPSDRATLLARQRLRRDKRTRFKNAASIRAAVDLGKHVFCSGLAFHVRCAGPGRAPRDYRIRDLHRGAEIGLTREDGWTLAADIQHFFCAYE